MKELKGSTATGQLAGERAQEAGEEKANGKKKNKVLT